MIRILIADDHEMFRQGLRSLIAEEPGMEVVADAARSSEVLARARETDPDVVLLDIGMPGRSCVEVVSDLKKWKRGLAVLVVTAQPEDHYAIRLLKEGADGYITKEKASEELIEAIHKVFQGGKYVTTNLAEVMARGYDPTSKLPHEHLSDREYQVMRLLADARTVSEIADELNLSVKTVSTYRTRILEKMGLKNNAEIMRYALRHGLIDFDVAKDDGGSAGRR